MTQTIQLANKETQKIVLKTIFETPSLGPEELFLILKSKAKNISQEEVFQVLNIISPDKNWYRTNKQDIQKEILTYVWTLESQVLFVLPVKQKDTTIAEFNQLRLQNNQTKVSKDLIRHILILLSVDSKNLSRFRKFVKNISFQHDFDLYMQVEWLFRITLSSLDLSGISSGEDLSKFVVEQAQKRSQEIIDKIGKSIYRLAEKFVEKYFPKDSSADFLKDLITIYQNIYHKYETGSAFDLHLKSNTQDYNELLHSVEERLNEAKNIIEESHEGGFFSKLISGKVKNREGVIKKLNEVKDIVNQLGNINSLTNKSISDKVLLLQKLQSDYENVVMAKNQIEKDLYGLTEKLNSTDEKNIILTAELKEKTDSLNKTQEKISSMQEKIDKIPELESKINLFREDLTVAKEIALRLYSRVQKLKGDLLRQNEKSINGKSPEAVNKITFVPRNDQVVTSIQDEAKESNNITL